MEEIRKMKKKTAMILIGGLLICLIGGCGKDESNTVTMESADETVAEVAEEVEEEVTEPDETNVEETDTDESPEVEEESESGTEEFPTITDEALAQDKSADYGVYSTSSFDLDQFLDENGEAPEDWNYESKEYSEFSGRFAYPDIIQCELMDSVRIYNRTDCYEGLSVESNDGTRHIGIAINSGLDMYHSQKSFVGYDSDWIAISMMFTTQTSEGETEVLHQTSTGSESSMYLVDEDGNPIDEDGNPVDLDAIEMHEYIDNQYIFNIGNFSVWVYADEDELTEDEIQMIIDNISLKH